MNKRTRSHLISLGIAGTLCAALPTISAAATAYDTSLFQAQELTLDLFGSGSVGQQVLEHPSGDRITDNGRLGAGVGLNYFFSRYLGIGGDAYTESTGHSFIDSTSGNLIGRIPLGNSGVAPYAFGGGGYQFDKFEQWFWNAGAGIEFRFSHNIGIFADGRYVFADKTDNYGLGRLGLRVKF